MPLSQSTFGNSLSLRVDGAIGAMTLSPSGRDALLAGRRGLFVIDLDDPFTAPRWLHHITLWEVADVQWSPHHSTKPLWVISTSNQRALLWDLNRPLANAISHVLHQHTRAISDINFHPSDPELLATCSIDTFALAWDMRAPRTPAIKWAEWRAGATQVKWNHKNPYQLATSHDHSFYVWDYRKGALPLVKIHRAHAGKINGLDFSHGLEQIMTASNDKKVKVWDLTTNQAQDYINLYDYFSTANRNPRLSSMVSPQVVIDTDFPVAKARWLPFGRDMACGIMPLRGGHHAIHVANFQEDGNRAAETKITQEILLKDVLVREFEGHNGDIKDFLWRQRHKQYRDGSSYPWTDYQLVTWSSHDYDLKLWDNDDGQGELYEKVNYVPEFYPMEEEGDDDETVYDYKTYLGEPPVTIDDMGKITSGDKLSSLALLLIKSSKNDNGRLGNVNHLDWISGVRLGGTKVNDDGFPTNLGEEIAIVGRKFPKVRFEKISVSTGQIVVSFKGEVPETKDEKVPEPADYSVTFDDDTGTVTSAGKLALKPGDDGSAVATTAPLTTNILNTNEADKLVFMRLKIDFPQGYPFLSGPKKRKNALRFEIDETHELSASAISVVTDRLDEIAQFYTNKHHKYCLEACLRMLMGEKVELDDEALMACQMDNDDILEAIEEIPSDDGDDLLMIVSDEDDEVVGLTQSDDERPSQNVQFYDLTPVPKGCGATWTPTGQLVCFFLPTDDKPKKLDVFHFADAVDELVPVPTACDDSSSSELSLDDSEEDDFQDEWDALIAADAPLRARVPALFKTVVGLGNEYVGVHLKLTSLGTTNNPLLIRKAKNKKNLNVVGIYDFSHLMPAKIELGYEYRILGDAPELLARHNSEVAAKYGLTEIAHTWQLLEMLLIKNVDNLGTMDGQFQHGFEKEMTMAPRQQGTHPMFFWGHHPFGHSWLIKEMFLYFERQGDLQMLAMMACILHENATYLQSSEDSIQVPIHTPYQALPPVPTTGRQILGPTTTESARDATIAITRLNLEYTTRLTLSTILPKNKKKQLIHSVGTPNSMPVAGANANKSRTKKVRLPPVVSIEMTNVDSMDFYEDTYVGGLLSSVDTHRLARYRQEYADLLYMWGLPVNRIKILKFNYADGQVPSLADDAHSCHIALRSRRKQNPHQAFVNFVTFIELSKANSWNLGKRNIIKYCNLCSMVVIKNFVACTTCEHLMHTECAIDWWRDDDECPSGCGCKCMEQGFAS